MTLFEIRAWLGTVHPVIRDEVEQASASGLCIARTREQRRAAFDAGMELWIIVHEFARARREAA